MDPSGANDKPSKPLLSVSALLSPPIASDAVHPDILVPRIVVTLTIFVGVIHGVMMVKTFLAWSQVGPRRRSSKLAVTNNGVVSNGGAGSENPNAPSVTERNPLLGLSTQPLPEVAVCSDPETRNGGIPFDDEGIGEPLDDVRDAVVAQTRWSFTTVRVWFERRTRTRASPGPLPLTVLSPSQ
jgi:hypothetical protein